jgi:hypothetical protein
LSSKALFRTFTLAFPIVSALQLDLSGNELCGVNDDGGGNWTAEGIIALADALKVTTSLTLLDISRNGIGAEGAKAVAEGLKHNSSSSLTKIWVSDNRLGAEGATTLCNALRESTVTKVQELGLEGNNIGPEGAKAVAAMAAIVASVTNILVGGNNLRDEGTIILCAALRGSTVSKVQELGLSSNGIGPDGAKAVAALCAAIASVTEVR